MNVSSFRYSGLVHTKSVGVAPSVDKKGVIFVYKKNKKIVSFDNFDFEHIFSMMNFSRLTLMMTICVHYPSLRHFIFTKSSQNNDHLHFNQIFTYSHFFSSTEQASREHRKNHLQIWTTQHIEEDQECHQS